MEVRLVAVGHGVQGRRPHLVEPLPWNSGRAATGARRGGRTRGTAWRPTAERMSPDCQEAYVRASCRKCPPYSAHAR
ncbi:hypothetical protein ABZ504_32975, partial [Streptomyces mirabilis]|uniref:hypothetical protein n=1 Tax=Streptomyces mirabilis TaxID=68239 RepID=UPI0033FB54D8